MYKDRAHYVQLDDNLIGWPVRLRLVRLVRFGTMAIRQDLQVSSSPRGYETVDTHFWELDSPEGRARLAAIPAAPDMIPSERYAAGHTDDFNG